MWRIHLQVDRLPVDALVVSCYPCGLGFDLAPDLCKIIKPLSGNVQKLSPLLLPCYAGWCVRYVNLIGFVGILALAGEVDKLENERPPCYDAAASGEEVPADDVLEDG